MNFTGKNNKNKNIVKQNNSMIANKNQIFDNINHNPNNTFLSYNLKNKSRNNKNNLFFLTDTTLNDINNNIKTFNKTLNKDIKKKYLFSKKSKKVSINTKKDFYNKKIKKLLLNLEDKEKKSIFKNKENIFNQKSLCNKEIIPVVRTQEELNYYLINDFKENLPLKLEISKSLKNRRMDEQFEEYKTLIRERRYKKHVNVIEEYRKKIEIKMDNKYSTLNKSISSKEKKRDLTPTYKRKSAKRMTCFCPEVTRNEIYKKYCKNKKTVNENKTKIKIHYSQKNNNIFHISSKNSKEIFNFNSPKKRNESEITITNQNKKSGTIISYKSNHINKITNISIKNEQEYKDQKKKHKKFLKILSKLRAKNYIEQVKKFEAEENKLNEEKENNEKNKYKKIKLSELNEEKLKLKIKKNNIFLNSFGIAGKNINNKEDDIDEDNFQSLKNYHFNLGMGATYMSNLKFKIEPRYILKYFQNKTIDKYKRNKGIFFGPFNRFDYLDTEY